MHTLILVSALIAGNQGWAASPLRPQAQPALPAPSVNPDIPPETAADPDDAGIGEDELETSGDAAAPTDPVPEQISDGRRFDGVLYYLTDWTGQEWQATDWPALWDHVQRRNAGPAVQQPAPCRILYDPSTGRMIQVCPNR